MLRAAAAELIALDGVADAVAVTVRLQPFAR